MVEYVEKEAFREVLRKSHEAHASNSREEVLLDRDIRLLNEQPASDVVEANSLIEICFHEFCSVAGDSPCGCDGCPYGEYGSDGDACYEEYKKRKINQIRGDNNAQTD